MPQPNQIKNSNLPGVAIGDTPPSTPTPGAVPRTTLAPYTGPYSSALAYPAGVLTTQAGVDYLALQGSQDVTPGTDATIWHALGAGSPSIPIPLILDAAVAGDDVLELGIDGETLARLTWTADGTAAWSPDGAADPDVLLVRDVNNDGGAGALGLYPRGGASHASLNVYDSGLTPDGSETGDPNVALIQPDQLATFSWDGSGGAHLKLLHDGASNAYGRLEVHSDNVDLPTAPTLPAIDVITGAGGAAIWQVTYDGTIHWPAVELALDEFINTSALGLFAPDGGSVDPFLTVYDHLQRPDGTFTGDPEFAQMLGGTFSVSHQATSVAGELRLENATGGVGLKRALLNLQKDGAGATTDSAIHLEDDTLTQLFDVDYVGRISWTTDTHLQRVSAGVLEIEEHGGGLVLTSPDGTKTKQIQLSNAGTLVVV